MRARWYSFSWLKGRYCSVYDPRAHEAQSGSLRRCTHSWAALAKHAVGLPDTSVASSRICAAGGITFARPLKPGGRDFRLHRPEGTVNLANVAQGRGNAADGCGNAWPDRASGCAARERRRHGRPSIHEQFALSRDQRTGWHGLGAQAVHHRARSFDGRLRRGKLRTVVSAV
jgi:hypothetical protein